MYQKVSNAAASQALSNSNHFLPVQRVVQALNVQHVFEFALLQLAVLGEGLHRLKLRPGRLLSRHLDVVRDDFRVWGFFVAGVGLQRLNDDWWGAARVCHWVNVVGEVVADEQLQPVVLWLCAVVGEGRKGCEVAVHRVGLLSVEQGVLQIDGRQVFVDLFSGGEDVYV